ncbi:2-dehydropantoate 2-reductase [Bacillus sp. SD088]|uniref:2-dehydropantoate 2-reductase n=1 Tax=Bacillus sp. SD088 TaxID=2782012 RepID=UPI001A96BD12|nr:2-dehydropantoate 2-reductase [Bacillus sp. SD088]MBO0994268.1 2-dehydropantoate 2-reductase [Bacillus sp. SD088]
MKENKNVGDEMKIGILGGGAVGLLFSTYLSLNHQVVLLTRTEAQARDINEKGIILSNSHKHIKQEVTANANFKELEKLDLTVIAVKQYNLVSLMKDLLTVPVETPLLFIQNGIGHIKLLETLPQETIYVGTVEHGVKKLAGNHIQHTGEGVTNIALFRGNQEEISCFPKSEAKAFPFCFHKNYKEIILAKLVANSVINPLTSILKVKNGSLIENPYYYEIFKSLHAEISSVFPEIDPNHSLEKVIYICRSTKENRSSMLSDMLEGRKTEIDAILGSVLEYAEKMDMILPLTTMIFEMIKGMEEEAASKKKEIL